MASVVILFMRWLVVLYIGDLGNLEDLYMMSLVGPYIGMELGMWFMMLLADIYTEEGIAGEDFFLLLQNR